METPLQYKVTQLIPDERPWLDQVQQLLDEQAREGWELVTAFQYPQRRSSSPAQVPEQPSGNHPTAEKLEPKSARRAVGRKKVPRRKPVVAKKKSERRRGRVKPTERVAEQAETAVS
jgi:hypothetical protein